MNLQYGNKISHREKFLIITIFISLLVFFSLSPIIVHAEENENSELEQVTVAEMDSDIEVTETDSDIEVTEEVPPVGNTIIIFNENNEEEEKTEDYEVGENDRVVYINMTPTDVSEPQTVDLSTLESYVLSIDNNIVDLLEVVNRLEICLLLVSVLLGGLTVYIFVHWSLSKKEVL